MIERQQSFIYFAAKFLDAVVFILGSLWKFIFHLVGLLFYVDEERFAICSALCIFYYETLNIMFARVCGCFIACIIALSHIVRLFKFAP